MGWCSSRRLARCSEVEGIQIDERKLRAGIEIIGHSIGDQIDDYQKPWLDSRLPDGSRVAATYPPISPQGVMVTIRKFLRHFTTDELVARGALTEEALELIVAAVQRTEECFSIRWHFHRKDDHDQCFRATYTGA